MLNSIWEEEVGSELKHNVNAIVLKAKAYNTDEGYLILRYEYENHEECLAEQNKAEDSAL